MISSWLVKVVLAIAVLGFAVLELGSPLIARAQADDAAHNIADGVAFELTEGGPVTAARVEDACAEEGAKESVELLSCGVGDDQRVQVQVRKEAWSLLLENWSVTEDWYRPTARASSERSTS